MKNIYCQFFLLMQKVIVPDEKKNNKESIDLIEKHKEKCKY